jgi:hypothetical protein
LILSTENKTKQKTRVSGEERIHKCIAMIPENLKSTRFMKITIIQGRMR